MIIDTHAHLYAEEFDTDLDNVIKRAKDVGVSHIVLPNIDVDSIANLNRLVDTDSQLFKRMMGLHPCYVDTDYTYQLEVIKKELTTKNCVAIGEIGIDLYWDKSKYKIQELAFLEQCQWAAELDLPIAIHSRESTDILIDLLTTHFNGKLRGVFHCFVGDATQASRIVDLGFHLGIGGVITFKNSNLKEDIKNVPVERLLLETDAPYLAPMPHRGKRNESSYLSYVLDLLACSLNMTQQQIADITTANALKLFKL